MKKKISLLIICAVLFCLCLGTPCYAASPFENIAPLDEPANSEQGITVGPSEVQVLESAQPVESTDENNNPAENQSYEGVYIFDMAGLLSAEQVDALQKQAEAVSEEYNSGVYIATVEDFSQYANSIWQCGEMVYKYFNMGIGQEKNGILLILSMRERDYDLTAYGAFSHTSFTDYGKSKLAGYFLDNFRNNDWYGGFSDYIKYAGSFMYQSVNDKPVDVPQSYTGYSTGPNMFIVVFIPLILAFVICNSFKNQMKTAIKKTEAMNYISPNSLRLHVNSDRFINRTVHREFIQTQQRGGGGMGGTSINSGGFSHSSGKF